MTRAMTRILILLALLLLAATPALAKAPKKTCYALTGTHGKIVYLCCNPNARPLRAPATAKWSCSKPLLGDFSSETCKTYTDASGIERSFCCPGDYKPKLNPSGTWQCTD